MSEQEFNDIRWFEQEFYDVRWFARRLGMKESWVRKHARELPHHSMGRLVRYCECCIEKYREQTASDSLAEIQISARSKSTKSRATKRK